MIYLDNAATTPVASEVLDEMLPFLRETFGNPSSIHSAGQAARCALDVARDRVAGLLGGQSREIIFTSGGTEADNLAIRGVLQSRADEGRHFITSSVEHEAVLDTARAMEAVGWSITVLPVDRFGAVHPESLSRAIRRDTTLVSVMLANNEVGTVQPIRELAEIAHAAGALFHTDAVQGAAHIGVTAAELGADLISISSHKMHGPKGCGALWVRHGVPLAAQVTGGGQERRRRSGTENVAAIAGFGKACEMTAVHGAEERARLLGLRDRLISGVLAAVPDARLTGHPTERLPNHASFIFDGVEGEPILINLDFAGICASSGSACSSGAVEPSHVLTAMGFSAFEAAGALRLTLGRYNTAEDVEAVVTALPPIIASLRRLSTPS
jgi:cysteine desulfurase